MESNSLRIPLASTPMGMSCMVGCGLASGIGWLPASDVVDLEHGRRLRAGAAAGGGVLLEVDAVRRDDRLEARQPGGLGQLVVEASLQYFERDEGGGGRARRCAEQGDDGFVGGGHELGAELELAFLMRQHASALVRL